MNGLNIETLVEQRNPDLYRRIPRFAHRWLFGFLDRALRLRDVRAFCTRSEGQRGVELLDEALDFLDVSFSLTLRHRRRIPSEGRLVVVANHPLGGVDALALLRALLEVRPDVWIVANDVLTVLPGLSEFMLPVDLFSGRKQKSGLLAIEQTLEREGAVVFFPAAEVDRPTWRGVQEGPWQKGPVHFARKCSAPVLPVWVGGRNSRLFYAASLLSRRLSMLLLPRELFSQRGCTIVLKVGDPIPASAFAPGALGAKVLTGLLRRHVQKIGQGKRGLFRTETCIVHPVERRALLAELAAAELLGTTDDGKRILLAGGESRAVLREIGRLRELTFRRVGEGTGQRLDLDDFDPHYRHIVLWDERELEVAGAYRLAPCAEVMAERGLAGLYAASLFALSPAVQALLPSAIELGRSFVQPRYWNSRALDSLWQGIGAYLAAHPEIRTLFGCVSISNSYPEPAKDLIVRFYRTWFGAEEGAVVSPHPYVMTKAREQWAAALLPGRDYRAELRVLKETLREHGCAVPTLYKQYAELCTWGGVKFLGFGVDPNFGHCVDGFLVVDVAAITPEKRARYIEAARLASERRGLQAS